MQEISLTVAFIIALLCVGIIIVSTRLIVFLLMALDEATPRIQKITHWSLTTIMLTLIAWWLIYGISTL